MTQLLYYRQQILSLLSSMNWRSVLDIFVVSLLVYYASKLIRQTRANSVIKGFAIMVGMMWLSDILSLSTINWILRQVIGAGAIMLVVLFQPELRRALEQIGRSSLYPNPFIDEATRLAEHNTEEMVHALTNLARRKVGALVVMERKTGLKDIVASGTTLDAEISSGLIENIFEPNTPLHDGAVVIKDGRITAAACFLPLSENSSISRELGTRHRAALGISESTDAVVLVVSEETGVISMAHEGKLTRYLDSDALREQLRKVFLPEATPLQRFFTGMIKRKEKLHAQAEQWKRRVRSIIGRKEKRHEGKD